MLRGELKARLRSVVLVCYLLFASLVWSGEARARVIDNTHPVYNVGVWAAGTIPATWEAVPDSLKPYTVFSFWYHPDWGSLESYRAMANICDRMGIDYFLTFWDLGNGTYQKPYPDCSFNPETYYQMSLSEIQTNYLSRPHFLGVEIIEAAALPGGVKGYEETYIADLINLMGPNGKYFIWKDGTVACWNMGKTQPFVFAQQSTSIRNAIQAYPNNVILVTKYSSYHQHYLTDANAMGWWLSGLTAGWGVNFENFWWATSAYGPLLSENDWNGDHWPGVYMHQIATQSDGLAGQKFLDAAAAGAVYFGFEQSDYPITGANPSSGSCSMTASSDTITAAAAHNLAINDMVTFAVTIGGVTKGANYYVLSIPTTTTFTFSTTPGGQVFDITDDVAWGGQYFANPDIGAKICAMTASSDTVTTAATHGLAINDRILFGIDAGGALAGINYYVVSIPTATTFKFSTYQGGPVFDITADVGMGNQNYFAQITQTPLLKKVIAPMMTKLGDASNPWIPDKTSVLNKLKVVYQATNPNSSELDIYPTQDPNLNCLADDGTGQELFRHLYGNRLTNKMMVNYTNPSLGLKRAPKHMLATTGKYYFLPVIPYLSPGNPPLTPFSNVLDNSNWATYCSSPSLKMTYFTNKYLPEYTGDALAVRFNDKWFLNNPRENTEVYDGAKFTLNLQTASAKQLSGILPQGTFALVDEEVGTDVNKIQIRVNNYRQLANAEADGWDDAWKDDPVGPCVQQTGPSCDYPNPPYPCWSLNEDGEGYTNYLNYVYAVAPRDATSDRTTTFIVKGVTGSHSYLATGVNGYTGFSAWDNWNATAGEYTVYLTHNGPVDLDITAVGNSSRAPVPNPSAPIAWWKLNGNTNDDGAYGLANNGTLVGSPSYVTGKLGQALRFPTAGQKMTTDDSRYYSVHTNFTMSLWVKPSTSITNFSSLTESNTGISAYLNKQRMAIYPNQGFNLYSSELEATVGISVGTNGVAVFEHTANHAPCILKKAKTISSSAWTHLVVVYENGTPRLYLNGVKERDGIYQSIKIAHPGAQLAGNDWGAQYTGYVDDYRIYDRVLNDAEIRDLYSFPSEVIENTVTFNSVAPNNAPIYGWQDSLSPYGINFDSATDPWTVWDYGSGMTALMNGPGVPDVTRTITLPTGKKLKRVDIQKCGAITGTLTFHSSGNPTADRQLTIQTQVPVTGYQLNWSNPAGDVTITIDSNDLCGGSVIAFDNFVFSD